MRAMNAQTGSGSRRARYAGPSFLVWFTVALVPVSAADYTALDRYIAQPDSSYGYELTRTVQTGRSTAYQIQLTSQSWLTPAEVDRIEWRHWVTIFRPERLDTSTALLFINGGSNTTTAPAIDPLLITAAEAAGAVVINLSQVPNQPITFTGESRARSEDSLIAYTWDRFLKTGDERWPARLPMTKAAVRAMDAVTSFLSGLRDKPFEVTNFIVVGGSKRGWTTWTTAAVDSRVVAIAPIVADVLNMEAAFVHHWRSYGFWAPAVRDYEEAGLMSWFGTPQLHGLREIEDPYEYRERLSLPKYLIHSTGDQFFLPDSSQFYFNELPGEKYLRYVPNTDHRMATPEAVLNLLAWFRALVLNQPRPRFYWRVDRANGTMTVRVLDKPAKVLLWEATNPDARDFRLETIGPAWHSRPLTDENGTYRISVPAPERGWTAFLVELTFPGGTPGLPLVFTTEVVVAPDVYPFEAPPGTNAAARRPTKLNWTLKH